MFKRVQTIFYSFFFICVVFFAEVTFAAPANFKAFTGQLIGIVNLATSALFSAAIAFFFWNLVRNLWGYDGGNAEQREKLQQTLFWGILIIFVMVSVWGIIAILQQTLSRGLI